MTGQGKNLIKIWCVLAAVFILGGVSGVALDTIYNSAAVRNEESVPSMPGDAYFEMLKRELDLAPEQASYMQVILDDARAQYKNVCAEVRPRYDVVREIARGRMRVLLSPEQQKKFDQIVTQEDCKCPEQKK
ncbi:MAG TPA: hypothetical protein VG778_07270 [Blastocatellia bacterium]|nr:hypothetical protein [Blastocatellia bacterium]